MTPETIASLLLSAFIAKNSSLNVIKVEHITISYEGGYESSLWMAQTTEWSLTIRETFDNDGRTLKMETIQQTGDPIPDLIWLRLRL